MPKNKTTNNDKKNKTSEGMNNTGDRGTIGFPVFIIIILLVIIWILTNFTVFICTVVMVLIAKIVQPTHSNTATNKTEIDTRPSPQARMKSSSTMTDDTVYEHLTNFDNSNIVHMRDSEAELHRGDGDSEMVSKEIIQQRDNKGVTTQDTNSSLLANEVEHLSDNDVKEIEDLIAAEGTSALLISSSDDNSTNTQNPLQTTITESTLSAVSSNTTITTTSTDLKSAFITENVMKVAVSYSGQERNRVLNITRILKRHMKAPPCSDAVFFDKDFQHEICRLDGLSHLQSIYRQAHLVVAFLSPTYNDSRYCRGEWRTIADRFLRDTKNKEATQLLLVKLGKYDMIKLDLVNNDFDVDGTRRSNAEIAEIIFKRWELIEKNLKQSNQ